MNDHRAATKARKGQRREARRFWLHVRHTEWRQRVCALKRKFAALRAGVLAGKQAGNPTP